MATSLGYGGYREPLCGNCPENGQQQFNQTMTALVHKNCALWTGCYVFRYLSRRTAFYPTVIRRDLENVFL